jgi:hypothetical protein
VIDAPQELWVAFANPDLTLSGASVYEANGSALELTADPVLLDFRGEWRDK